MNGKRVLTLLILLALGLAGQPTHTARAATIAVTTTNDVLDAAASCAGCTVEFFSSFENEGEGNIYEGSLLADGSGNFSGTLGAMEYTYLTATTTHPVSGTSEFCEVYTFEVTYLQFLPLAIR